MIFNIGDIVRVRTLGGVYNTYDKAIDHFNLKKNIEVNNNYGLSSKWIKKIIIPENAMYENWVVVGKAIHGLARDNDWIVYHIMNCKGESLLIDDTALTLRNGIETDTTKKLKEKYRNYKPLKIESHNLTYDFD